MPTLKDMIKPSQRTRAHSVCLFVWLSLMKECRMCGVLDIYLFIYFESLRFRRHPDVNTKLSYYDYSAQSIF